MDKWKNWIMDDTNFEAGLWAMGAIIIANVLGVIVLLVTILAMVTNIVVVYGFWAVVGFLLFRTFRRDLRKIDD